MTMTIDLKHTTAPGLICDRTVLAHLIELVFRVPPQVLAEWSGSIDGNLGRHAPKPPVQTARPVYDEKLLNNDQLLTPIDHHITTTRRDSWRMLKIQRCYSCSDGAQYSVFDCCWACGRHRFKEAGMGRRPAAVTHVGARAMYRSPQHGRYARTQSCCTCSKFHI
jgi:hypothetical protein